MIRIAHTVCYLKKEKKIRTRVRKTKSYKNVRSSTRARQHGTFWVMVVVEISDY